METLYKHIFSRLLLLFLLTLTTHEVLAQKHQHSFVCSYYGEDIDPEIKIAPADADAQEVISQILAVIGLKPNFELRAADVPNAAAVIIADRRYILYNPQFIAGINAASGNDWAGISILAHEIGHHLNGHTLQKGGSRPDLELEADEFSGFVLNKLGAGISDAQAAMSVAASQKSSHTHPAKSDRLAAIARGWNNATGNRSQLADGPKKSDTKIKKPVVVKSQPAESNVIDEKYIAFDVRFKADPKGKYHITTRGNLVNIADG
ncbi:MAG TPA: hypothetical protein VF676_06525 [Flavobacterium sp.]|jgi:hypothetical protein